MQRVEFISEKAGQRLDLVLVAQGFGTRSYVQKLILQELVELEGVVATKPGLKVGSGQKIAVTIPEPESEEVVAEALPLDVIYEDEALLVINKPRGQVVHPAAGHSRGTLVNALLARGCPLSSIGLPLRPGIVHRVDKETSGLLLVAKTDQVHLALVEGIKKREILRQYQALVHGKMKGSGGTISAPLGRDPRNRKRFAVVPEGKEAITYFSLLEALGNYSFLELQLETGRTHQIRVHLAHFGHPVVGDRVYGPRKPHFKEELAGQALHAQKLALTHPITGEALEFEAPLPQDFQTVLTALRQGERRWKNGI